MTRDGNIAFSFAGVDCADMGLKLRRFPARNLSAQRGECVLVPGRDGTLWLDGGALENTEMLLECESLAGFSAENLRGWLLREGDLIFSDVPNRAFHARLFGEIQIENVLEGYGKKRVEIPLSCAPHRYHHPAAAEIVLTQQGVVTNPGMAESRPKIAITATGEWTLAVNGCLIEGTDSMLIDSEKQDCLSADGMELANDRAFLAEFPILEPGVNAISWTGSVAEVKILPRWRD